MSFWGGHEFNVQDEGDNKFKDTYFKVNIFFISTVFLSAVFLLSEIVEYFSKELS